MWSDGRVDLVATHFWKLFQDMLTWPANQAPTDSHYAAVGDLNSCGVKSHLCWGCWGTMVFQGYSLTSLLLLMVWDVGFVGKDLGGVRSILNIFEQPQRAASLLKGAVLRCVWYPTLTEYERRQKFRCGEHFWEDEFRQKRTRARFR